jgi:hypothetical protein
MGQWDRFYKEPAEALFPDRATYHISSPVEFLVSGGWNMLQSAMFLLPRSHIEKHGVWNPSRSPIDDFEFYTRMISASKSLRYCPGAKVYYRSGLPASLSSAKSREHLEGKLMSLLAGVEHLMRAEDSPRTRRASANVIQAFDYAHYPDHPDLRARARTRAAELGGSNVEPDGPPGFKRLRRFVGWKVARRVQRFAEARGLNAARRRRRPA